MMTSKIFFAITILPLIALLDRAAVFAADKQGTFDLSGTDITIYEPDTNRTIGSGHYRITVLGDVDLIEGEDKYNNGEYDREVQRVRRIDPESAPVLIDYQHSFFNADGSPQYMESLDAATGSAVCERYGAEPDERASTIEVPRDTYSGASQLALLAGRLRQGEKQIEFHSFNCLPGPKIFAITANAPDTTVEWPRYPGNLLKLEMQPDLGWLNAIAAPFIPKFYVWFDPHDNFNYVGGQFARFYKGRHVLVAKCAPSRKPAPNAH
jgi:hypothetical protein